MKPRWWVRSRNRMAVVRRIWRDWQRGYRYRGAHHPAAWADFFEAKRAGLLRRRRTT